MGGPGSGKGTQCAKLVKDYPQLCTFSNGELIRKKVKENSPESKDLEETMSKGEMVSTDYMLDLMEKHMEK